MRLRFKRYLSHHRPDDGESISQNVASLNIFVHDVINHIALLLPSRLDRWTYREFSRKCWTEMEHMVHKKSQSHITQVQS